MKKLIPALVLLLVSAMVLSTSSYAWFSMNRTVSATGMALTATTPVNLLISNKTGAAATSDTYNNIVAFDELFSDALYAASCNPSSSLTDIRFNAIEDNNFINNDNNGVGGVALKTTTFLKSSDQSESTVVAIDSITATKGYWAVYDYSIKLGAAQSTDANVYLSSLTVAQNYSGNEVYNPVAGDGTTPVTVADKYYTRTGTGTEASPYIFTAYTTGTLAVGTTYYKLADLSPAVRVAVYYSIDEGTTFALAGIYAVDTNSQTTVIDNEFTADGSTLGETAKTTAPTIVEAVSPKTYESDTTNPVGYIANVEANEFKVNKDATQATQVKLIVWVEGEDAACVNANAGAIFTMSVAFSIAE